MGKRTCLILAKTERNVPSGNNTTALRLKELLHSFGIVSTIFHPDDVNAKEINERDFVIGIHAYYCAIPLSSSKVPFIVIFGGTDLNVNGKDEEKREKMGEIVAKSVGLIAFTPFMASQAIKLWPQVDLKEKLFVIPQSVEICRRHCPRTSFQTNNSILSSATPSHKQKQNWERIEKLKFIVWIGGIREVKNPLWAIRAFLDWENRPVDLHLFLIGPILDPDLGSRVAQISKTEPMILFLGPLGRCETEEYLSRAVCLLNTSDSEGMPATLLEAMKIGTAVVARRVPGNVNLIKEDSPYFNGLLFSTQDEMKEKITMILDDPGFLRDILQKAYQYVEENHNVVKEKFAYSQLLMNKCLL